MKKCPECGTGNDSTNLFCPMCGYSFIDSPEKPPVRVKKAGRRNVTLVIAAAILVLGLAAGVTSYVISREIERGRLVTVEIGTVWKCVQCGEIYRERVVELQVEKSEKDLFEVETIDGRCYRCRYGDEVGDFQDYFYMLSENGNVEGTRPELEPAAAEFIAANTGLFPAESLEQVERLASEEDPRRVERDFSDLAGSPVLVRGRVLASEVVPDKEGRKMTLIQIKPYLDGEEVEADYIVVYPGVSPLLKGDEAECYLLPCDILKRDEEGGTARAVFCLALYMERYEP